MLKRCVQPIQLGLVLVSILVGGSGVYAKADAESVSSSAGSQFADNSGYRLIPDRRRDQIRTEPGYIASPIAVNIPGIGFSYGVVGSIFNINQTEMDSFFFTSNGDTNGFGLGLVDTPIWGDRLTFNLFHSRFRDTGLESHDRGIHSDPANKRILKLKTTNVAVMQLTARFWKKRIQFNLGLFRNQGTLDKILNDDGEVIADPEDQTSTRLSRLAGGTLDFTDDRSDPRKGWQLEIQYFQPPLGSDFEADYYIMDYNTLFYVPVGRLSTWVFNAYRSDAIVTRSGETDVSKIRAEKSLSCENLPSFSRGACEKEENKIVAESLAANRNGTAAGIGGTQRMRSYVTGRFKAAHAQVFGSEFRLNLTEEFAPFNVYVAKGIRTGVQLAFFSEWGTVADDVGEIFNSYKRSYGAGLRLIVASGFIVRLDVARGDEGIQPTLFFNYPWFVF